jgi:hypothetical protein
MAQDKSKPFIVRLLLFVVAGFCGVAIVTVAIFMPFLMVANWGSTTGGSGPTPGLAELLLALGVLAAGFGLPSMVFSKDARRLKYAVPIVLVVLAALIWPVASGDGDPEFAPLLLGVILLHGLAMFWAFGLLTGRSAPPEWKDMP